MTVANMVDFQTAVFAIVMGAAGGLPVADHVLTKAPNEFIRLDGFRVSDRGIKNGEIARHTFEVHFFGSPTGGATTSRGNKRAHEVIGPIHSALMAATILGTRLQHETLDVEPSEDGASVHAMSRYSAIL